MKRIAVYCGSSIGASDAYREGAVQLGKELAKRQIALIYGGASIGLMGTLADTVLKEGGEVIGVIPKILLDHEVAHQHLTKLFTVETMHERKAKMADLADGFIAMPGGPGTLEEFFEVFTWAQIGLHEKPLGMLNINGYYNPLSKLLEHMAMEQFMEEKYCSLTILDENPKSLLDRFHTYESPGIKTFEK